MRTGFCDWSPAAQKAYYEAQVRRSVNETLVKKMRVGPVYRDGELVIPSYIYLPNFTPLANAEWKQRGLRWDPQRKEWRRPVPAAHVAEQVAKAREVYFRILKITPLKEVQDAIL